MTAPRWIQNPTFHLDAVIIRIADDLNHVALKAVLTHEFGHAIGLGETGNAHGASVMNSPISCVCTSADDRTALNSIMYANHDHTIYAGQQLDGLTYNYSFGFFEQDESVLSANDRFRLVQQADGNLVAYDWGRAYWSSGTNGWGNSRAAMQTDGNFVIYVARMFSTVRELERP
ncbi:MAG: hypothetical protein ACRD12_14775 [Acidimicrobiales bacterium]